MIYILPFSFLALFLFFSVDKYLYVVSNRIIFFLIGIFFIALAGVRYEIATDYGSYYNIFVYSSDFDRLEPGFKLLISIFRDIGSFNLFIFFIAFTSIALKLIYFNSLKRPFFALFLYLAVFYVNLEFNIIRQGLAIAISFFAVEQGRKKNFFEFLCLLLFASSIHISAFVLFFFYPFLSKEYVLNKSMILLFFIFILVFRVFLLNIFIIKIIDPIAGKVSSVPLLQQVLRYFVMPDFKISSGFFRRVLVFIVFLLLTDSRTINLYGVLYCVGIALYVLFMGVDIVAHRFSLGFDVFCIPLFSYSSFKLTKKRLIILTMFIAALFILYWSPLPGYVYPYKTYLNF